MQADNFIKLFIDRVQFANFNSRTQYKSGTCTNHNHQYIIYTDQLKLPP